MPSTIRPAGQSRPETNYYSVPNPTTPDLNNSPEPNSFISPDGYPPDMLDRRRSDIYPAPSLLNRDSTYDSLAAPRTPGAESPMGSPRNSWGSNLGLAAAAGGIAGAENYRRPGLQSGRHGQSNLAQSTLGWNNNRISSSSDDGQGHIAPAGVAVGMQDMSEKSPRWAAAREKPKRNRKWLWAILAVVLLIAAGVGIGLGVALTRKKSTTSASGGSGQQQAVDGTATGTSSATAGATTATAAVTSGGQGSLITLSDGSSMTYENTLGGTWVWDEADPFNNGAQAQSYTPRLNESWVWGVNKVYGVNLGGWLNTEPFIVPALYEIYATGTNGQTAVDEYTLSQNMGSNMTAAMTDHYETFITERDFAEIASAGLNWVRIPLPYWAIETYSDEPFLEGVSWQYFIKAIGWARKYGLRINLDFHALPGSQNGWNHSGRLGEINWLKGVMGIANAQRGLEYIRTLAQFISQPQYSPVIQMFGFVNEPNANAVGKTATGSFYLEAYNIIREITGIGEGNGAMLSVHDGFLGPNKWFGFLPGSDRIALDQHTYMVFGNQQQQNESTISQDPCNYWAYATDQMSLNFGVNVAGEWSAAMNDCGKWINNVGSGARWDGTLTGYTGPTPGSCDYWNDYTQWNETTISDLNYFVRGSMDALQNYFFWTWKIGNSTDAIEQPNPFWHYRLGLQHGWIPADPRDATGTCTTQGVEHLVFDGTYSEAYMTGGNGAGTISVDQLSSYAWPPASLTDIGSASMTLLPQLTQTGNPITMSGPTYTSSGSSNTIDAGNGWAQAANTQAAWVPVASCSYAPQYSANSLDPTQGACGAGEAQTQVIKRSPAAPTPAPARR